MNLICLPVLFVYVVLSTFADLKPPTVLIAFLVRNKAHTLPYFLTALERLDYPKDRISLWIRSDRNVDNTIDVLSVWLPSVGDRYHGIDSVLLDTADSFGDQSHPLHWSQSRFDYIIDMKEQALQHARDIWADYIFMLDADVFLTNPATLSHLVALKHTAVAPMLKSDGMYSNFWRGMTDDYYYERTEDYKPILHRVQTGCFPVPMILSAVLIDLRLTEADNLTYDPDKIQVISGQDPYNGPRDDMIAFGISARNSGVQLHLCNEKPFGYLMVPPEDNETLQYDYAQLVNLKLEVLSVQDKGLEVSKLLSRFVTMPVKDMLGFDKVFMINLRRRPDRRSRMMECFEELGLSVEVVDAVDGRTQALAQDLCSHDKEVRRRLAVHLKEARKINQSADY